LKKILIQFIIFSESTICALSLQLFEQYFLFSVKSPPHTEHFFLKAILLGNLTLLIVAEQEEEQ